MAPEPAAATMYDLVQRLKKASEQGNLQDLIESADEVLNLSPGDEDALRYKLVGLIKNEEFEEAFSVIEKNPESNLDLKAHCLYHLKRYDEALKILSTLDKSDFTTRLEAQIFYKQGDLEKSTSVYKTLCSDEDEDVKCNALAAYFAANKWDDLSELLKTQELRARNSYEFSYNIACALIRNGAFTEAEEHLLVAKRLGQEKLAEDDMEDVEGLLSPLDVNLAYIKQVQGQTFEASEAYLSVLKRNLLEQDMPTVAVATNNLAALRKNKDVFDSLRKFEGLLEKNESGKRIRFPKELNVKLTSLQKEAIIFNYVLLLLAGNRVNQVRELVPLVEDEYKGSSMPYLLKACMFFKEGKLEKAEEVLNEYAEKSSEASTEALILCAQARASAGNYLQAADSLERIDEVKYMPAIVATMVDLKQRGGDSEGAEKILDAAVNWWTNSMEDNGARFLELVLPKAAELKLLKKKFEEAAKLYEKLTSSSSDAIRLEAMTGLICSYAETDVNRAESFEQHLPPLEASVDVDMLERTALVPEKLEENSAPVVASEERAKKKRKRKPRYPKGYDPENPGPPPDPERWLPMRERSTYRPKKKDKRAAIRGSQGSVAKEPVSNGPSSSSSSSRPSNAPAKPEPKAGSSQRSKKKGRR